METYKLENGRTLEIRQVEYPMNPREDYNITEMICFHGRYNLGDNHDYKHQDYSGWEEMEKAIIKREKPAVILPLYLYDHGGITISTSPFSCRWDSGQIGFVFVSKERLKNEWGVKRLTKKIIEDTERILLAEVETYDNYLRGEVYSYTLLDENDCIEDSCSGYFGDTGIKQIKEEFGVS